MSTPTKLLMSQKEVAILIAKGLLITLREYTKTLNEHKKMCEDIELAPEHEVERDVFFETVEKSFAKNAMHIAEAEMEVRNAEAGKISCQKCHV